MEKSHVGPHDDRIETRRREPTIRLGTDQFLNRAALGPAASHRNSGDGVILNFVAADIREVVHSVLGDFLGYDYLLDPKVTGTATIQSAKPIDRSALLPVLEELLQINDAALVKEGELIRVVPWAGAARSPVPLSLDAVDAASRPGFGLQVVPLDFVAAAEMAKVLEPIAPEGSILEIDSKRNLLVLAGSQDERSMLMQTIRLFDVDWIAGMSFGLFPLDSVDPETLVEELQLLFGRTTEDLIRFVPVARIGSILVITARSQYLQEVANWIEQLDRVAEGATRQLFVYPAENLRASELAEVLNEILGNGSASSTVKSLTPARADIAVLAEAPEDEEPTEPASDATAADPSLPNPAISPGSQNAGLKTEGEIRVIAMDSRNAVIVLASPRDFRMIEGTLRQLDVAPLQVLIEATIAEVTLNDELRYGVQWFLDSGDSEFTLSEVAEGSVNGLFPGFSYLFRSNDDIRVVLNALDSVTDVNVISSPQLMVLDNQSAELQVGDQVPIATQSAVSVANPDAPIVNSIEFRDTGVILRITPRVNQGGLVLMEIEQEVSSVVETVTSGIDSPTIRQRRILSNVAIQNGETVSLGGLIRDDQTATSSGFPVISDIPVLGALFSTKTRRDVRTELLVLLTPRVISNAVEARNVTRELRERMRAVAPLGRRLK